jgi:aminomuconate-semialdehyde/2-hydroxymuconate-6-semialdehyde dehydrogenase
LFVLNNYINGELIEPIGKGFIKNINPSTGQVFSELPDSDDRDVDLAVHAAVNSQTVWSNMPREERSQMLLDISRGIEDELENLAKAESMDSGKTYRQARDIEIPRAAKNFRFFATAILHESSEFHQTDSEHFNYTLRKPLGTVGCISPWNLPLYLFTWKIAPALAAGNTVVAKPSELTPVTAYLFSKICQKSRLPPGVLNIIHGTGAKAGQPIVSHKAIKAISFTGGTKTGKQIAATAAPMFKKLSLELGGKNPTIIFDDCNYEKAVSTAIRSAFLNQGEICLCGSRLFVHENIYEKFRHDFIQGVSHLKIGDPLLEETDFGALVSLNHLNKVSSYVELAQQEGGKVIHGGKRLKLPGELSQGFYFEPTIIEGLSHKCRVNQEEIFGPVVTLTPFQRTEEVIAYANNTPFGLSANLWTTNLDKAHYVANELDAGVIWINCWLFRDLRTPFGGMKESGVGREGGWDALRFFSEPKNVCTAIHKKSPK